MTDKVMLFDELKNAVDKFICDTTQIYIANGMDLSELDMKDIPKGVFMLPNMALERGKMYAVVDNDLKLKLFEFCKRYPDRCFRGEKE